MLKQLLVEAKHDYGDIGGWKALTSGTWLSMIIQKSFTNYWNNSNVEYFYSKYNTNNKHYVAKQLITVAAKNAAILGGISGAAISADELVALSTAAEGGVGLPANLAIAATTIGGETIGLLKIQLKLVADIGNVFGVTLDPEDPEDVLIILAYSLGSSASEIVGKVGVRVGVKMLQRTIIKTTIPIVSIAISSGWNYTSTKTVGKIAMKHFRSI